MSELFSRPSYYQGLPRTPLGAAGYVPESAPEAAWPTVYGAPGQTSRSGEPLLGDDWDICWQAPLGAAANPSGLLVGAGSVVALGADEVGIWRNDGALTAHIARGIGTQFLDLDFARLMTDGAGGVLSSHTLSAGARDAVILLSRPTNHRTSQIVQGPGVLVIARVCDFPESSLQEAVVESVRITDYSRKGRADILYGIEPLGGIIRRTDAQVVLAASRQGPVLATPDGIRWCDWRWKRSPSIPSPASHAR